MESTLPKNTDTEKNVCFRNIKVEKLDGEKIQLEVPPKES